MDGWIQDLKVGWRSLARTPGFTIVVVLMPFAIGPDLALLKRIGSWLAAAAVTVVVVMAFRA